MVAAGCGLSLPLPALTAIEISRQGTPFPGIRHEQEKSIHQTHVSTPSVDTKRDIGKALALEQEMVVWGSL